MAQLPVALPPGKTVRNIGGTNFLVSKGRRRRFKLPAKTRRKIAASARRFKLPILTIAANTLPLMDFWNKARAGDTRNAVNALLAPYTGIAFTSSTSAVWNPRFLLTGLVPNLIVAGVRRFGIFKGTNAALARSRVPLRFS